MTSKQQSRLNMYLTTDEFLTTNDAIASLLPKYSGFHASFQDGIVQIRTSSEQQMFDKSGLSTGKSQFRSTLVTLTIDASRKMQAYSKMENNQLLMSETKFTESELKNSTDNELKTYAQGTYDRGQTNLTGLAPYGINAESQTALLKVINDFTVSIPQPRIGTIETKQSTEQISKTFAATDVALANIDTLVEIIRISQPEFYSGYKSARKIIETGTGTLSVQGLIIDASTGQGLKGVNVSFALSGANSTAVTDKITAEKGGFNIKTLPEGTYNVSMKKNGYTDQLSTLAVTNGELAVLNVEMQKSI